MAVASNNVYVYPAVALVCHPSTDLSPLPVDTSVALDTCDAVYGSPTLKLKLWHLCTNGGGGISSSSSTYGRCAVLLLTGY